MDQADRPVIKLLYVYAFLTGVYQSFFYAAANAIFMERLGSVWLPEVFLCTGVLGFLLVMVFSRVQRRSSLKFTSVVTLGFFLLVLIAFFVIATLSTESKVLAFAIFAFVGPVFIIIPLVYGSLTIKLFDLRQSKNIYAFLTSGEILSALIGFFSIKWIADLVGGVNNLLIFSILALAGCALIVVILFRKAPEKLNPQSEPIDLEEEDRPKEKKKAVKISLKEVFQNKYYRYIGIVSILSAMAIYLADFGFLGSAEVMADDMSLEIVEVVTLFYAVLKLVELVLSFASNYILKHYGMKLGLLALSGTMTACVILAVSFGAFFEHMPLLIFVFLALNRLCERTVRKALEAPAGKILYQPLSAEVQLSVQTMMEGTLTQVGIAIAGILLLAYNLIMTGQDPYWHVYWFAAIMVVFMLVWLWSTRSLYSEYRVQLQSALGKKVDEDPYDTAYGVTYFAEKLNSDDESDRLASVSLLNKLSPLVLDEKVEHLLNNSSEGVSSLYLESVSDLTALLGDTNVQLNNFSERTENSSLQEKALDALRRIHLDKSTALAEMSDNASEDEETSDKPAPARRAGRDRAGHQMKVSLEQPLLIMKVAGDRRSFVQNRKLRAAVSKNQGYFQRAKLTELLANELDGYIAKNLLLQDAPDSYVDLEILFEKTKDLAVKTKILEIYGNLATAESIRLLLDRINHPNRIIKRACLNSLKESGYVASQLEIRNIRSMLEEVVKSLVWTHACLGDLEGLEAYGELIAAIKRGYEDSLENLFTLLGFIYEPDAISMIQANLIGDDRERVFALELIDNFLDEEHKKLIAPLFDEDEHLQVVHAYRNEIPQKLYEPLDRLKEITTCDFSLIGVWPRVLALDLLGKEKLSAVPREIIVSCFHPEDAIAETAFQVLVSIDRDKALVQLERLSERRRANFNALFKSKDSFAKLIISKVKTLRQLPLLQGVRDEQIIELARIFQVVVAPEKMTLKPVNSANEDMVQIVSNGEVELSRRQYSIAGIRSDRIAIPRPNVASKVWPVASFGSIIYQTNKDMLLHFILGDLILSKNMHRILATHYEKKQVAQPTTAV